MVGSAHPTGTGETPVPLVALGFMDDFDIRSGKGVQKIVQRRAQGVLSRIFYIEIFDLVKICFEGFDHKGTPYLRSPSRAWAKRWRSQAGAWERGKRKWWAVPTLQAQARRLCHSSCLGSWMTLIFVPARAFRRWSSAGRRVCSVESFTSRFLIWSKYALKASTIRKHPI